MQDSVTDKWQFYLKTAIKSNRELGKLLELPLQEFKEDFPVKVPLPFIKKMQKNNPADPLLLQVLMQKMEAVDLVAVSVDPLDETNKQPVNGIIHKYNHRALVILSGGCAINCRYCFRRHFAYNQSHTNLAIDSKAFIYLQQNKTINEVILSGGDPLLHQDNYLEQVVNNLATIKHIHTVRIHTRLPIVIPYRITDKLITILTQTRLQIVMVIHCNHHQELDELTAVYLAKLRDNNIPLFNQSVLLKNINDNAEVLIKLSHKLFTQGVTPYYLHTLDLVQGSSHFFVDTAKMKLIQQLLLTNLPGYLVPKLVTDGVDLKYKQPFS